MIYFWEISLVMFIIFEAACCHPVTPHRACILCPPGMRVMYTCSAHHNTICRLCEEGTFSETTTESRECKPCFVCPEKMYVDRPCSYTSDTICSSCADVPVSKSVNYFMSCELENTMRVGVHDQTMHDDTRYKKLREMVLKASIKGVREGINNVRHGDFIHKRDVSEIEEIGIQNNEHDINSELENDHKNIDINNHNEKIIGSENSEITTESGRDLALENIDDDEKHKNNDNSYIQKGEIDEEDFVNDEATNNHKNENTEKAGNTGTESRSANQDNTDGAENGEIEIDIKEETGLTNAEDKNKNGYESDTDDNKETDIVDEDLSATEGDDARITTNRYSPGPSQFNDTYRAADENRGKSMNPPSMGQIPIDHLSSDIDVPEARIAFVNKEYVPVSTLQDDGRDYVTQSDNDDNQNNRERSEDQKEPIYDPANKTADLEADNTDDNYHNDGSILRDANHFDENVELQEGDHHNDVVNEETIISSLMITDEHIFEKMDTDPTESSLMLNPNENTSFEEGRIDEGRIEAVKFGFSEHTNVDGEDDTPKLHDDISTALMAEGENSRQDNHVTDRDTETNLEMQTQTSVGEDNNSDGDVHLGKLSELEIDRQDNDADAGDNDLTEHNEHKHGEEETTDGESPVEKNENSQGKKRAAIILGVAIGGAAFFILIFLASRCWKSRSGKFRIMKKMKAIEEEESVQLRSMNHADTDSYDDSSERSSNGLYRRGPKVGPSSPRMTQKDRMEKVSVPETSSAVPLQTLSPVNEELEESPPSHEPLMKDLDKLKYIDDSTDDEYVNLQSPRPFDYRLSNVVEENPPSPSHKQ